MHFIALIPMLGALDMGKDLIPRRLFCEHISINFASNIFLDRHQTIAIYIMVE